MKQHILLLGEYIKINLSAVMEYRFNFMVQSLSMIANDAIWLIFWWIFFERFDIINGWQFTDIMLLWGMLAFSFGISMFIFGNTSQIANIISEGKLDFYLTFPKNELFHMLISRSSWFAFGDIVFGLFVTSYILQLYQWPAFFLYSLFSIIIMISFSIIIGSLSFFFGNAEETARNVRMGLISLASYPVSIFSGNAKTILLTLIPAGFLASVPVDLIRNFTWEWFALLVGMSIGSLGIAILIFKIGLKRYESGSMVTLRM